MTDLFTDILKGENVANKPGLSWAKLKSSWK